MTIRHSPPQRPLYIMHYSPAVTSTNIPAAVQEYNNNSGDRFKVDLTGFVECRAQVRVFTPAAAGANFRYQYSTDESTWNDLTTNASLLTAGTASSTWAAIPVAALNGADVWIRVVTDGGNGVDDPLTAMAMLHLR